MIAIDYGHFIRSTRREKVLWILVRMHHVISSMAEIQKVTFRPNEENDPDFHSEVLGRISEMEQLNKESRLARRGVFDKVFGSENVNDGCKKGTLLFSYTQSGYQTEDITVLDQISVSFKMKNKTVISPLRISSASDIHGKMFKCTEGSLLTLSNICVTDYNLNSLMLKHSCIKLCHF